MLEGLLWLRENSPAYCVTFVEKLDKTELLRRFGGDLSRARLIQQDDWQAREALSRFGDVIQAGWCDGWAFIYEENGYRGTLPQTLQAVSKGTVAVSVFYNINAHTRFCYAKDQTIVADFDPIDPVYSNALPEILALLREEDFPEYTEDNGDEQDEDDNHDFVETMFNLAENVGVRLTEKAIAEKPLLCSFIRNPFSDFVGDLLSRGPDEQTINRLLDLLDDWEQRRRFLSFFQDWWNRERFPHHAEKRVQAKYLRTVTVVLFALLSIQIIPPMLKLLEKGKEEVRSAVSELLKIVIHFDHTHEQEGTRERLFLLTFAQEPEVALQAAIALGTRGDWRVVEPSLRLLSLYPNERKLIQLLGQPGASSAAQRLFSMLNPHGESIDVQRDLIQALEQIEGTRVVERWLPLLNTEPETLRECSFQQALLASLARQGDVRVVELLLNLLDPYSRSLYSLDFQLHLLKALENLGEKQAIGRLAQLLVLKIDRCDTYERKFQEHLVKTLRQLGDTRTELQVVETALRQLAEINYYHPPTSK